MKHYDEPFIPESHDQQEIDNKYFYNENNQLVKITDKDNKIKIIYEYDNKNILRKKIKVYFGHNGDCYKNVFVYEYNKQNQKVSKIYKELIKPNKNIFSFFKPEKHIKCQNKFFYKYKYNDKKQKNLKICYFNDKISKFKYQYENF
ncbi:hypothetical protein OC683_01295 ['Crotalaria aegyptiaca' phytoplasma]|uniref:DUF2963 domain-containing protein n=1 Tax=Candidatus Phytoplasma crotalariae TaxID=2982627 RepID=A0ABT9D2P6_9MOLU|nr:hypothetical protein ['Crotalaria aegyptiaca' phytoplasma]MDO8059248.1 hypothetical protein ['Crotalaria aegyptiaca' phytoplasma]